MADYAKSAIHIYTKPSFVVRASSSTAGRNRTPVYSFGDCRSTTELPPRSPCCGNAAGAPRDRFDLPFTSMDLTIFSTRTARGLPMWLDPERRVARLIARRPLSPRERGPPPRTRQLQAGRVGGGGASRQELRNQDVHTKAGRRQP